MKQVSINGYTRITKRAALKRFNNGECIYLCPVKLRPGGPWHPEITITNKGHFAGVTEDFNKIINQFEYYNCNVETGYYAAYYIREV
jgi:hypothetical protein